MENNGKNVRTHRVGSITTGTVMILFGILFLVHLLFGCMNYMTIFSFWPVILVGLGIELFISNFLERKIVYDKASIFLLFIMAFFAMLMAFVDVCMKAALAYYV